MAHGVDKLSGSCTSRDFRSGKLEPEDIFILPMSIAGVLIVSKLVAVEVLDTEDWATAL